MKKLIISFIAIVLPMIACCQVKQEQSNRQNELVGVYQYTSGLEGMFFMTEEYFINAAKIEIESSTVDSIENYENEYNLLIVEAGTWTVQDSIITFKLLFDKNPSLIGTSSRITYSFEGDTMLWGVLNENGEVWFRGSCKKLE